MIRSAVPVQALDKVSVSNEFGVMIPEEAGLEMNYIATTKDSPTTVYGDIDIGIHYMSPVRELIGLLKEDQVDDLIEFGYGARFTL